MAGFIAGIVIECVLAALLIVAIILVATDKIRVRPVSETSGEGVTFSTGEITFEDAYKDLSYEQRRFLEKVRTYALAKPDAVEKQNKMSLNIKSEGKPILKLKIRHGTVVALYRLENDLLKDYKRSSKLSSAIRHKETEVILADEDAVVTACNMVDLMIKQYEKEREMAKERRREARRAKAESSEGKKD